MSYPGYPNDQRNSASAVPVYIVDGASDGLATSANQVLEIAQLEAITTNTTGAIKTPFVTLATASGTLPAGYKSVTFQSITGTFSVYGVTFPVSPVVAGVTWQTSSNDVFGSISYTVSPSSSVLITGF